MTSKPITLARLKAARACQPQVDLFLSLFPDGQASVTPELCVAHASRFDWDWAADRLLTDAQRQAYFEARATAEKAYSEARATAWKAYFEAVAPAQEAYDEATAPAQKAYDEATALARKAYNEAVAPARKAYDEARALAFAHAFNS